MVDIPVAGFAQSVSVERMPGAVDWGFAVVGWTVEWVLTVVGLLCEPLKSKQIINKSDLSFPSKKLSR